MSKKTKKAGTGHRTRGEVSISLEKLEGNLLITDHAVILSIAVELAWKRKFW